MLYSIIPPVLVILSLAGIIIFLMRKARSVANFSDKKEDVRPLKNASWLKEKVGKLSGVKESLKLKIQKKEDSPARVLEKREAESVSNKDESNQFFQRRKTENASQPFEAGNLDMGVRKIPPATSQEKTPAQEEAIEKKDLFEKILIDRIASNPKDIEAYERLGEYYMEIKNWNYAKECFKQVIKLHPGSIKARMKMRKLGRLLAK